MKELSVLTEQEVEAIHQATLKILGKVGIAMTNKQGRDILTGAGATVNGSRVFLPPDMVEDLVASCPSQVTLHSRTGEFICLENGRLHWQNLGGASHVYEARTGLCRAATVQDVRDATRLLDALDSISSITAAFTPQDVPAPLVPLAMFRHAIPCTTKPIRGPGLHTAAEVRYVVRMAAVVYPADSVLSLSVSPISPLLFPDGVVEAMITAAQLGVALKPLPCPIAGATAPMSLGGALAQQNAEVLASIVLAQLVQPGLPMIYAGRLSTMDPRTGIAVMGGVEMGLASGAMVQIAHRYGLPSNVYGLISCANDLGLQSGYERALTAAIPALAGSNELSGVGSMAAGTRSCLAQMVIDDEIAAHLHRTVRGIAATDDALAVSLISSVMDGSRTYIDQPHTARYLRMREVLPARLAERRGWEEWNLSGREGMTERAQTEAERILSKHEVPALSEDQERELDEIMREAQRELLSN